MRASIPPPRRTSPRGVSRVTSTRRDSVSRLALRMERSPLARHLSSPADLKERHAASSAGRPYLVLRTGDGEQRVVQLPASGRRLSIGRRPENDIALPWDARASRLHAELEQAGGDWLVIDDGLSANGTWVGDRKVVGRRRLRDGDVLRIGGTLIAFCAPATSHGATDADGRLSGAVRVSPAQRRVLVALCRPYLEAAGDAVPPTNSELARALFLSVDSIKTHMRALFDAFGLDGVPQSQKRAALVDRALRLGLVTERDLREPQGAV